MKLPDLSDVSLNTSDIAYRIVLLTKIVNHIRNRLMCNQRYSNGWAPNLQSAIDVFVLPIDMLLEQVERGATDTELGLLLPTPTEVIECAKQLAGMT